MKKVPKTIKIIMKIRLLILSLLFITKCVFSKGNSECDSLINLLPNADDTSKIRIYIELSKGLSKTEPDSALSFALNGLTIANQTHNKRLIAKLNYQIGFVYSLKGNGLEAIKYFQNCIETQKEFKDKTIIVKSMTGIARELSNSGDFPKALDYFLKALKIAEKKELQEQIGKIFNGIGTLYLDYEDYDLALEYYEKALNKFIKINKKERILGIQNNIGTVYLNLKKYPQALDYFSKAVEGYKETNNKHDLIICQRNIGRIYEEQKKYLKALEIYSNLLKEASDFEMQNIKVLCLLDIAAVNIQLGKSKESIDYSKKAAAISKLLNNPRYLMYSYSSMIDGYEVAQLYKNAFQTQKEYIIMNDSIYNIEKKELITEMQLKYETQKKEAEIANLKAEKEEQEKIRTLIIYSVVLMILVLIILMVRIRYRNKLLYKEKEFEKEKGQALQESIDQKNRELTSVTMHILKKNEILDNVRKGLLKIEIDGKVNKKDFKEVIDIIDYDKNSKGDWENLKKHFESVHPNFFVNLKSDFPDLTQNDLKHCAYLKLNLSIKEVARMLSVDANSVKVARYRLKKKLNLTEEQKTDDFLLKYT